MNVGFIIVLLLLATVGISGQSESERVDEGRYAFNGGGFSILLPNELKRVEVFCFEVCFHFEAPDFKLYIDADAAAGQPSWKIDGKQRLTVIDGKLARFWSLKRGGWNQYGAIFFSDTRGGVIGNITITSQKRDLSEVAEKIFMSTIFAKHDKPGFSSQFLKTCSEMLTRGKSKRLATNEIEAALKEAKSSQRSTKEIEESLLRIIAERGVQFELYKKTELEFRDLGATEAILAAIRRMTPPDIPEQNRLYEVFVDNSYIGSRNSGVAFGAGTQFIEKFGCNPDLLDQAIFVLTMLRAVRGSIP